MAGAGGFLIAGWKGTVGKDDFSLLTGPLSALPVLLLVVVGGVTAVSGALIGALLLVSMPQVAADYPSLNNLMILLPGLAGISLVRNPEGLVSDVRRVARRAREAALLRRTHARVPQVPSPPPLLPEMVGWNGRVTAADLLALDRELGFATEECDGAA